MNHSIPEGMTPDQWTKVWSVLDALLPARQDRDQDSVLVEHIDQWTNWKGETTYGISCQGGFVMATLRVVTLERNETGAGWFGWSVLDMHEQTVRLVPVSFLNDERLEEYLIGWAAAVEQVLASCELTTYPDQLEAHSATKLKKARTADDYMAACLAKSRLGKLVA